MHTPVLILVIVALAGLSGRSAAPAGAATVSGFTVVHGLAFGGQLRAVSARAPSDVWAVGMLGTPNDGLTAKLRPYAEHWNGHTWRSFTVPAPANAIEAFLTSISALSESNVWAAGFAYYGSYNRGFVEHWNRTRWALVSNVTSGDQVLALSATSVWVTSTNLNFSAPEHWNGSTWTAVAPPTVNGTPLSLSVATGRPGDVWFTATADHDGVIWPEMVHWNGSTWSVFEQPVASPYNRAQLNGVAMSNTGRVYAVGLTDNTTGLPAGELYGRIFDAGGWGAAPLTQYPGQHDLLAVAATGDGQAWAVGFRNRPIENTTTGRTLIEHWDNAFGRWVDVGGPNPCPGGPDTLTAVAAVGSTQTAAYAVGICGNDETGEHPLILHHS